MNKLFIISIFFSCLAINVFAQSQGNMKIIGIPDGLSNTNVQSLYQDRFGFIWIMTADGLNRYNGNKIKIYRNDPDDPESIFANESFSAVEDNSGFLWIGGKGFISRYDYAADKFEYFQLDAVSTNPGGSNVISLFTDLQGRIWAGSMGGEIYMFNNSSNIFELIRHTDDIDANYNGEIWSIIQLKNGKILFSNRSRGIFQYNETSGKLDYFYLEKNYTPINILRIQEENDGTIWFSGENVIIRYNPNFFSYEILDEFQVLPTLYHCGFHKVSDENYIFVSDPFGIIRYNPKTSKIVETIRTSLAPYWFIVDKYDILWIASLDGLLKYDPRTIPFTHLQLDPEISQENRGNILNNIVIDQYDKNFLWSVSTRNKLIRYNRRNGELKKYKISLPEPYQKRILGNFVQDRQNNFYFGLQNTNGILKYNLKNNNVSKLSNISYAFTRLFRTEDLAVDQNNNLFISSNLGLVYSNLNINNEIVVRTTANRKYSDETNASIQQAIKNSKELAIITKANESKTYSIDFTLENKTNILIHCIGEGLLDRFGEQMWDHGVLSSADGTIIYKMKDYSKTFHAGGGRKNRREYKVLELEPGNYNLKYILDAGHSWPQFNTEMPADSALYGIQVYQISEEKFRVLDEHVKKDLNFHVTLPVEGINDIEISRKFQNTVYLSSPTQGLIRYNYSDQSFLQYTFGPLEIGNNKNVVQHCYEDIAGNLWLSTQQGLIMLNPDNGKWRVFTEKDGLPSNNILKSIEDNNSDLWIISLGGLSKFNKNTPADEWNFVNYDTRDGLSGYAFRGDLVRTPNDDILFIVGDIVHRFSPTTSNTVKPDIVITDMKISDISVFDSQSPVELEKNLMEMGGMNLPYNLNDISFNFNTVHYSRPYKNRVFYKLEGFNNKWIEPELGTATFTNLDPGNYEFKVRGISADGIRNDEGKSIKIEITPPWWRTTFAYIGYFILFSGLIFAIDRIQRRRLLMKERAATAIKEAELRAQLAESENERKTKELEEARNLQLSMLPKELPRLPHLDIAVYMQTATEVGGDYYDFHVSLDGTLTVVVGDATGHGMKAGTMVTAAKSLFRSYAPNPDILLCFQEFTRCIKEMNFGKLSMCLTMLKIKGNKLEISTAGMPPSFIFRRDTRVVEEHLFKAMPLGTMEKFPYEIKDTTLNPGDTILLLSDGLPELKNAQDEMYGYKRIRNGFEDVAEKAPEEIVSYLKNEGAGWINNADPDDDVTFVVIKVK